jgi:hypothetical protein
MNLPAVGGSADEGDGSAAAHVVPRPKLLQRLLLAEEGREGRRTELGTSFDHARVHKG